MYRVFAVALTLHAMTEWDTVPPNTSFDDDAHQHSIQFIEHTRGLVGLPYIENTSSCPFLVAKSRQHLHSMEVQYR